MYLPHAQRHGEMSIFVVCFVLFMNAESSSGGSHQRQTPSGEYS